MADESCLPLRRRGRPKGTVNKTTRRFNEALLTAAEQAGYHYGKDGLVSYLQYHALNNPVPFFRCWLKYCLYRLWGMRGVMLKLFRGSRLCRWWQRIVCVGGRRLTPPMFEG